MGPAVDSTTTHESQAGALGIPEYMPPNRRRTFIVMYKDEDKSKQTVSLAVCFLQSGKENYGKSDWGTSG